LEDSDRSRWWRGGRRAFATENMIRPSTSSIRSWWRNRGFTLTELLVVIAVIAVLVALLMPALTRARESAHRVVCGSNLHQIAIAVYGYEHDNKGLLPIGFSSNYPNAANVNGQPGGWPYSEMKGIVYLLPYVGGKAVTNTEADRKISRVFFCPSSDIEFELHWFGWGAGRGSSYSQYCSWSYTGPMSDGSYVNSPHSNRDKPWRLLYSDLVNVGTPPTGNHRDRSGLSAGANCLYLDGHVEWVPRAKLTVQISRFGVILYLFPDTN
jgi:prepilin-type N-terminal cleavage/methylation domain-containing protein/prepilin-type processing-associated H-X9-DG protein